MLPPYGLWRVSPDFGIEPALNLPTRKAGHVFPLAGFVQHRARSPLDRFRRKEVLLLVKDREAKEKF
jgi:hypothetical protein